MKIGKWHFIKVRHHIFIANGKDPLRYFDLKRFKLVTYKAKGIKYDYTIKQDIGSTISTSAQTELR